MQDLRILCAPLQNEPERCSLLSLVPASIVFSLPMGVRQVSERETLDVLALTHWQAGRQRKLLRFNVGREGPGSQPALPLPFQY